MTSDRIFEETTPYTVLLYRKDRELRLWEVGGFLIGMIPLLSLFPFRSAPFVVSLLVLAAAVMAGMPALYRAVYRPRYILYRDRLEIRKGRRRQTVPLTRVKPAYDLPYFFMIDGKRLPLLVSDDFLGRLNERLEILRHGWE
ncbi:hypothetical protein SAMN04488025_11371 [Planifilum fulgidum]|uniref:PH domain-containing protein n=1 Tax=Planifilum fulgidum TaxID=201973 RepID=A0A1I2NN73_9BACL|nr:hypothetical protein [Planifilum fulgidum]SFG04199.1 hypothetical protein SAMN04488025_11371 [Planifilum fulgidum]